MAERFGHKEKWGEFVDVKINAPELLLKKLRGMRKKEGTIGIGVTTDPYQPVEKKYRITRKLLEVLRETDFRISMLTKSPSVIEDYHIITSFGDRFRLGTSISVMSPGLVRFLEPQAPEPELRLKALSEFSQTGINTYVFFSPLIPGFSDSDEELEKIFTKIKRYGIRNVLIDRMSLYSNVRENFVKKVVSKYPGRYEKLLEYQREKHGYLRRVKRKIQEISLSYGLITSFTF